MDRTSLFVAKAAVLFGFLVAVEVAAIPAFAVLLLGPSPFQALPELIAILLLADIGIAVIGTLVGALAIQTRARDLIVPLISLPLILPVVIAAGHATAPLFAEAGAQAFPPAGWVSSVSMISSSGCSPWQSSTFCWSLGAGRGLRFLSIASVVLVTGAFALVFLYAPDDADQGFVQKIFYLHVPLAIVALGGFVAGGRVRDPVPADRRPRSRPALLRGDSPVAHPRAAERARHRLDLGQGLVGRLVGLGRADAGLVPDRLPALRLPAAVRLFDRRSRAPGALAAVFTIIGGAFVPLNFLAVRLEESLIHPASSPPPAARCRRGR